MLYFCEKFLWVKLGMVGIVPTIEHKKPKAILIFVDPILGYSQTYKYFLLYPIVCWDIVT